MKEKRLGWLERASAWVPVVGLVLVCTVTLVMFTSAAAIESRPAGHPSLATAATTSADATATVLQHLILDKTADLRYGRFALVDPGLSGWIVMNPQTGLRSPTSNVDLLANGVVGGIGAAGFTVTGSPLRLLSIALPTGATLTRLGGMEQMTVDQFTRYPAAAQTDASGDYGFFVGGRLNVNPGQTPGQYQGTFSVTVEYQ